MVQQLPETKAMYEAHMRDFGEVLPHVLFGDMTCKHLLRFLETGEAADQWIERFCTFVESMWRDGDEELRNVVDVTILELLSDDRFIWSRFGGHISEAFKAYINGELLHTNVAMQHVPQLP